MVYDDKYLDHKDDNHPESPERLRAIKKKLDADTSFFRPKIANEDEILRVHSKKHLNHIKRFCEKGGGHLDIDTYATPESYEISRLAAGGVITASELVLNHYKSSYALVRPPGHHATAEKSMGFCIFNNLAIGLEHLREEHKISKFLIFDFDAHYGNGTAELFYDDPNVMYISIHQDPYTIFPGEGFIHEIGGQDALGTNLNLPMTPGSKTDDYLYILERVLEPVFNKFNADFYFFDVGFDAHEADPLSSILLDDYFYEWIALQMIQLTKRRVLVLEGGYNLEAMARANLKMVNVLKSGGIDQDNVNVREKLKVKEETKSLFTKIENNFSPFFTF
jgi:acetoin utilization deacetylase AcuC-like enzyme